MKPDDNTKMVEDKGDTVSAPVENDVPTVFYQTEIQEVYRMQGVKVENDVPTVFYQTCRHPETGQLITNATEGE